MNIKAESLAKKRPVSAVSSEVLGLSVVLPPLKLLDSFLTIECFYISHLWECGLAS